MFGWVHCWPFYKSDCPFKIIPVRMRNPPTPSKWNYNWILIRSDNLQNPSQISASTYTITPHGRVR
jgi:hypothetical protein